jgi:predicted nucleic acid-binding protein
MNIIIDTNIFISALIKDGLIRKILVNSNINFIFPEFEIEEVYEHKKEILEKSKLNEKEFNIILLRLIRNIRIIPKDIIISKKEEAIKIMKDIDPEDAQFIATALVFNCPIWSEDKHFKKQSIIKIYNTKELIEFIKTSI